MVSFDGLVGRLGVTNIFHLDVKIDKETLTILHPKQPGIIDQHLHSLRL